MMKIDVLTIFPKMFAPVLNESIIKRAQIKKRVRIDIHDLRDFTTDKHRKVDDRPFGGGPGMIFCPQPIFSAVESIVPIRGKRKAKIILLTPQGKKLTHDLAKKLSRQKHLVLICGHYEGVDQRVRKKLITDEISIGDYVLTCGELPAMVLIDCVVRLIPKVLGKDESRDFESFSQGLLEYPQYTRPAVFRGMSTPRVLLSGNHKLIEKWRKDMALKLTKTRRPDLLKQGRSIDR
ncbi:MAG: tRNA (guanosine(37)-N1)-methyltransferase TrmD [Candidatus Omnitrophica bacterium]|nr:tRNA (guanosine(37)-N1)-methyltransferase TrmD [Candidatus Omnitrophota bacterium]